MSKEFEAWHEKTTGSGVNCFNYSVEFIRSVWDAAESRGIAKGRIEGMREATGIVNTCSLNSAKVGCVEQAAILSIIADKIHAVAAAILSASQPQEIAGEGCVWVESSISSRGQVRFRTSCGRLGATIRMTGYCDCGKPIVIGGER